MPLWPSSGPHLHRLSVPRHCLHCLIKRNPQPTFLECHKPLLSPWHCWRLGALHGARTGRSLICIPGRNPQETRFLDSPPARSVERQTCLSSPFSLCLPCCISLLHSLSCGFTFSFVFFLACFLDDPSAVFRSQISPCISVFWNSATSTS